MNVWSGVGLGILVGILANLMSPKLNSFLIHMRDRLFLNRVYYIPQIQMRTITDIEYISLASKTFKLKQSGNAQNIYTLPFLISCTLSKELAEYLSRHDLRITLTFTGPQNVNFYPIDLHNKRPNYNNPKGFIELGPEEFKNPLDAFYAAEMLSPPNNGNFTVSFSYSINKSNSTTPRRKVKNYRVRLKNVTTFDSLHFDSITFEKIW